MTFAAELLFLVALAPPAADAATVRKEEAQRIATIRSAAPAAIAIFGRPGSAAAQAGGSGVLLSPDGFALTNFHVVGPIGPFLRVGLPSGALKDAVVAGVDPAGDLALIQLVGEGGFPEATFGDSDSLQVGQEVLAIGNPFLLADDFQPTVTLGVVSGLHRYQYPEGGSFLEYADCIQTDAAINPGNSGGPLFDLAGRLIGVNGRISLEKRGRVSVGVGYAVSSNQARCYIDHLRGGLICDHASLGAVVGADEKGRPRIEEIRKDSEAYRRGFRPGDALVSFAGRRIETVNEFKNVLGVYPAGWRVQMRARRGEEILSAPVRLLGAHTPSELAKAASFSRPSGPMPPGRPSPAPPKPTETVPPALAARYQARDGFANYAYQRAERDRVLALVQGRADFSRAPGAWTIELVSESGAASTLTLEPARARWRAAGSEFVANLNGPPSADPPGTGGMLLALLQWRRLLTEVAKDDGDIRYCGGYPASGAVSDAGPVERLHLGLETASGVETRWFIDRDTGDVRTLECRVLADEEPCEIHFHDVQEDAGQWRPRRLEIHVGGRKVGGFAIQKWEIGP